MQRVPRLGKYYVMSRSPQSNWHIGGRYYGTFEDASYKAAQIPNTRDVMVLKVLEHRHETTETLKDE